MPNDIGLSVLNFAEQQLGVASAGDAWVRQELWQGFYEHSLRPPRQTRPLPNSARNPRVNPSSDLVPDLGQKVPGQRHPFRRRSHLDVNLKVLHWVHAARMRRQQVVAVGVKR